LIAVLGFALFQRTVCSISRMASEFVRLERGEIEELGDQQATHELTEMSRIAEAFNKILAELKANTSELENLVYKLST
jgi:signal transduction histidine kinase